MHLTQCSVEVAGSCMLNNMLLQHCTTTTMLAQYSEVAKSAASAQTHLITSLYELDGHLLTGAFIQSQLHKSKSTSIQISYLNSTML